MLKLYILERFISPLPQGGNACFDDLAAHVCHGLQQARRHICAAACWFSHQKIFEVLLLQLRAGVDIEILLEYDTQNIRSQGLYFQTFIRKGGRLFGNLDPGLMHHKFAIIDERLLLTGSFNWTYNSNAENLIAVEDAALTGAFREEFCRLKSRSKQIFQVRQTDAKVFAAFPLFEHTHFPLSDLRKKVGAGAGVWVVRADRLHLPVEDILHSPLLPFDARGLLDSYWSAYRIWDGTLFDETFQATGVQDMPAQAQRELRCWARRMKTGDVVLLTTGRSQSLLAVGIVQSDPQAFKKAGFSSCRAIQWLKMLEQGAYALPGKTPGQGIGRFKGSALRVLQEVV